MSNITSGTLDSFSGKFSISDHSLISEVLTEYLIEVFYNKIDSKWVNNRQHILSHIPLEQINEELNGVWEGPGSVAKVKQLTRNSRDARLGMIDDDTALKGYVTPTVDDELTQED
jgi:hypothetical protein